MYADCVKMNESIFPSQNVLLASYSLIGNANCWKHTASDIPTMTYMNIKTICLELKMNIALLFFISKGVYSRIINAHDIS